MTDHESVPRDPMPLDPVLPILLKMCAATALMTAVLSVIGHGYRDAELFFVIGIALLLLDGYVSLPRAAKRELRRACVGEPSTSPIVRSLAGDECLDIADRSVLTQKGLDRVAKELRLELPHIGRAFGTTREEHEEHMRRILQFAGQHETRVH